MSHEACKREAVFRLNIHPGRLAINQKNGVRGFMAGGRPKGQIFTTSAWKKEMRATVSAIEILWGREPVEGPVSVQIDTWWPRVRHSGPAEGLPMGDVDAAGKALQDALEEAGVLGDDCQVYELVQRKHHGDPHAEIRVFWEGE